MPGCSPVVFNNVDANAWNCLKQKAIAFAQQHGVAIGPLGETGSESHSGFTASWAYDSGAQTLTITCTNHPWLLTCGYINGQVQHGIASTGCVPGLQSPTVG